MSSDDSLIPIPPSGFEEISQLIALTPERMGLLGSLAADFENTLDFRLMIKRLAKAVAIKQKHMAMISSVLMALNQLRISRNFLLRKSLPNLTRQ